MSAFAIVDKHLSDFSKRMAEDEFLLISVRDVVDILLDIRSGLDSPELILDGDELAKLANHMSKRGKNAQNRE